MCLRCAQGVHVVRYNVFVGYLYAKAYQSGDFVGAFKHTFDNMISAKATPSRRASTTTTAPATTPATSTHATVFPSIDQAHIGYKLLLFCKYLADQKLFPRGDFFPSSISQVTSLLNLLLIRSYQPSCTVSESAIKCLASEFPVSMSLAKVDSSGTVYCICMLLKLLVELQKDESHGQLQTMNGRVSIDMGELYSSLYHFTSIADQVLNTADHLRRMMFSHALTQIIHVQFELTGELLSAVVAHCGVEIKSRKESEELIYGLVTRQSKFTNVQVELREILIR